MIRFLVLLLVTIQVPVARAAGSEVANRNLGINAKQVARAQARLDPAPAQVPGAASTGHASRPAPSNASDIRIERIEAYASNIEELDGPSKPSFEKFGERLAADRPLTPAERAQKLLSFFLGGPPGRDPSPEERTEARVARGGTMLATPRGSLQ